MGTEKIDIFFPGVDNPVSASYTLTHGIAPSIATLEMVPQYGTNQVQASGDLVMKCGGSYVTVRGCRVDSASTRFTISGERLIVLRLLDRRWKWKFGYIAGRYNVRRPDNSIDQDTEKTPQELAILLFQAMGESNFNVGDLPNNTRPEINWIAENPAQQLQDLADSLGCRIVLDLNGNAAIRKTGFGQNLPSGLQITNGIGIDPPDKPESMKFVSGPIRFQQRLELEAVGEDTDGSIKLIDDLSYAPSGGWANESPYALIPTETDKDKRALAEKTVFRWYRIKDSISAPGYSSVNSLLDILPVDDFLVSTETDSNGAEVPRRAYVYGDFWEMEPGLNSNSSDTVCKFPFTLDRDRGIVQFNDFVVKLGSGQVTPATLYLVCSYTARDSGDKRMELRWTKDSPVSGGTPGTGPEIVRRDDVVPTYIEQYGSVSGNPMGYQDNIQSEVIPEANFHLQSAMLKYQNLDTDEREYPGIRLVNPDGAIQQVGWSVRTGDGGGAATRASRNSEFSIAAPSYEETKRIAATQAAAVAAKQASIAASKKTKGAAP